MTVVGGGKKKKIGDLQRGLQHKEEAGRGDVQRSDGWWQRLEASVVSMSDSLRRDSPYWTVVVQGPRTYLS